MGLASLPSGSLVNMSVQETAAQGADSGPFLEAADLAGTVAESMSFLRVVDWNAVRGRLGWLLAKVGWSRSMMPLMVLGKVIHQLLLARQASGCREGRWRKMRRGGDTQRLRRELGRLPQLQW